MTLVKEDYQSKNSTEATMIELSIAWLNSENSVSNF